MDENSKQDFIYDMMFESNVSKTDQKLKAGKYFGAISSLRSAERYVKGKEAEDKLKPYWAKALELVLKDHKPIEEATKEGNFRYLSSSIDIIDECVSHISFEIELENRFKSMISKMKATIYEKGVPIELEHARKCLDKDSTYYATMALEYVEKFSKDADKPVPKEIEEMRNEIEVKAVPIINALQGVLDEPNKERQNEKLAPLLKDALKKGFDIELESYDYNGKEMLDENSKNR